MPVLRFVRRVVQVPDTWEGWAMRILTIGIVLVLVAAFFLGQQVAALQDQVNSGRHERIAYQEEQTMRVCALMRVAGATPEDLRAAKC